MQSDPPQDNEARTPRYTHVEVIGATGTGKTYNLIKPPVDVLAHGPIRIFDAKDKDHHEKS